MTEPQTERGRIHLRFYRDRNKLEALDDILTIEAEARADLADLLARWREAALGDELDDVPDYVGLIDETNAVLAAIEGAS